MSMEQFVVGAIIIAGVICFVTFLSIRGSYKEICRQFNLDEKEVMSDEDND